MVLPGYLRDLMKRLFLVLAAAHFLSFSFIGSEPAGDTARPGRSCSLPALIPYRKGDKWGYCDSSKKIVVPPVYSRTWPLLNGLGKVEARGKDGMVDAQGHVFIPVEYDRIEGETEGMIRVEKDGKYGYYDRSGRLVIPVQYETAYDFREGLAAVMQNKLLGYIDKQGKTVIPFRYGNDLWDWPMVEDEQMRPHVITMRNGIALLKKDGRMGAVNRKGKTVIPHRFEYMTYQDDSVICARDTAHHYYYYDYRGRLLPPGAEKPARAPFGGGRVWKPVSGRYGLAAADGAWIIPPMFTELPRVTKYGYAMAANDTANFVVGRNGKLLCIGKAENTYGTYFPILIAEGLGDDRTPAGAVTADARLLLPFRYQVLQPFSEGLSVMRRENKYGIVDTLGNEAWLDTALHRMGEFHDGLLYAEKQGKAGYVDRHGDVVIPFRYERIPSRYISECGCSRVSVSFENGIALVFVNGRDGYVGCNGVEYFEN